MTKARRNLLIAVGLLVVAAAVSGCDLPAVDCSDINQPDNGSLVCIGRHVLAFNLTLIGAVLAILIGLGGSSVV